MQVDLEDLAAGYAHRPPSAAALARARRAAREAGLGAADVALDIGGGRGLHAAEWLKWGAHPVVVDPARGMAEVASRQPGVSVICGSSQQLPLKDDTARLAYFHLSLHYGDWRAALDETGRVLGSGGECWIWTMGEEHHRSSMLAQWFPSVGDIDAARFPDPGRVAAYLRLQADRVTSGKEVERKRMPAGRWRSAVVARFVSTLQLIPEEELIAGIAEFDRKYPDPEAEIEYLLTFDWIRSIF
jgi:SAM-dependent methyltransferase